MQNNILDKILITIAKKTNPWIVITDENVNMIYISDSASKISGYSEEDLIGKNPNIFRAYVRENNFYKELWDTITEGKVFEHVFVNKTKDGKLFYIEGKIIPIEIDGTKYFVLAGRDIIPEMKILKELEDIKNKDIVTGFYNYETFKNMFAEDVHNMDYGIVIAFKIENLSIVRQLNDTPNYHKILKHISEKLRYAIGGLDISIGRLSEDEFVTFMKNTTEKDALNSIKDIAKGLMDLELDPQKYHGVSNISIKIGVSLYGKDGTDIETLCRKANLACSYDSNDFIVSFFNEAMEHSLRQLKTADSLILEAFEKNQFCFYLQPYYRCTGVPHIKGFESLIRIVKDGKIYSPYHFIDYLEQSKHLRRFEEWSLDEISHIIRAIKKNISLNLSARSFSNEIFISMLLEKAQEPYPFLTVEITERTAIGNIDKTKSAIKRLKDKGIKIALDDFGTGYSSLNYLKELNADILKIDISFVRDIENNKTTKDIVEILILLARKLNMTTIAEGVETRRQLEILYLLGCRNAQGYLLCKPIPLEEAISLVSISHNL